MQVCDVVVQLCMCSECVVVLDVCEVAVCMCKFVVKVCAGNVATDL